MADLFSQFMQSLFEKGYVGTCYGCCLGVKETCKSLCVLDQVIARSKTDASLFTSSVDQANIELGDDLTWHVLPLAALPRPATSQRRIIGICVGDSSLVPECLTALAGHSDCCDFKLIATNKAVHEALVEGGANVDPWISNAAAYAMVTQAFDGMLVLMDMHALILCLRLQTPTAVVHASGDETDKMLRDMAPCCQATLLGPNCISGALSSIPGCRARVGATLAPTTPLMVNALDTGRRMRLPQPLVPQAFDLKSALEKALAFIPRLTGCPVTATTDTKDLQGNIYEVARLVCYCAIKRLSAPWLGQLAWRMAQGGLTVAAALQFAFAAAEELGKQWKLDDSSYCPSLDVPIRTMVDMSSLIDQFDCAGLHRSGLAYVLAGLRQLDCVTVQQRTEGSLWVDSYMDRTFHWGQAVLRAARVIPYQRAWVGFLHHPWSAATTWEYSCEHMFSSDTFQASLPSCKAIIALSQTLADHVRTGLDVLGYPGVPVHVLRHPLAPCPVDKYFTMSKFLASPNRWVVQIGSWLRNTYSIYALPISGNERCLRVNKAILIGREMQGHLKPDGLFEALDEACSEAWQSDSGMCRVEGMCRSDGMCRAMCRSEGFCRDTGSGGNQYTQGMMQALRDMDASVTMLPWMNNDAYDDLMSQSVVFLYLADASAVNVMSECIQRGTPVIVNRLPALEELLSSSYPGFYTNLAEAGAMATDISRIQAMHEHLVSLPKDHLDLNKFISDFQQIIG